MKSSQTLKFKNRQLTPYNNDQSGAHFEGYSHASNLATFSEKQSARHPSRTNNSQRLKYKCWNQTQQRFHTEFWLQKIIENPHQNFSLDAPLKRKSYNKQASDYITKKSKILELQCYKTPQQCKSKFSSIRRKVKRNRNKLKHFQQGLGFIDFIIEKAENLVPKSSSVWEKIAKVKTLRQNQGPFVRLALEESRFQMSECFEETSKLLQNYIRKKQKKTSSDCQS